MTDAETLERIIDKPIPCPEGPLPKPWLNKRRFISALSHTPLSCWANGDTIAVRPENVEKFRELLAQKGTTDEITKDVIKWLNEHPGEFIRFVRP